MRAEKIVCVIDNLISNAIKYSPVNTTIWVTIEEQRENNRIQAVLAVRDEGQGLTEADVKNAFGKFQRLSAQPTGNESSSGLGLFIVKEIVERHGGKVWVESAGKNMGATFFITLPALEQNLRPADETCASKVSLTNQASAS
ncbi:MAG: sensor histidine kinase [Chloroherpetonaceae bacterium]|nr:sensor histidine kinase [Chloroherpetonaceae bacterium]MDW8018586.1 sensor histidine kinase [Chloroherpetonaceae bacterium]